MRVTLSTATARFHCLGTVLDMSGVAASTGATVRRSHSGTPACRLHETELRSGFSETVLLAAASSRPHATQIDAQA